MKSQNDEVLNHLQTHKGITSFDAFSLYGITRISARIWDLRERGYKIVNVQHQTKDRRGKNTSYVEYRLVKEKEAV